QNIHICIEGNKIDLRGQTFEKAVIGLDAARKGYGIASLAQSLVDDAVRHPAIIAQVWLIGTGDLRRMENRVLVVGFRRVSVAKQGQIVGSCGQNTAATVDTKEAAQIIEGQLDLNTDCAQILLETHSDGGALNIVGGGHHAHN